MNDENVVPAVTPKRKSITVFYLPATGLQPEKFETTGKAGYYIHSDDNGTPIGYRIYTDTITQLIPRENVHRIEVNL